MADLLLAPEAAVIATTIVLELVLTVFTGNVVEVWPAHLEDRAWRFDFFGNELEAIIDAALTAAPALATPAARMWEVADPDSEVYAGFGAFLLLMASSVYFVYRLDCQR